VIRERPSLRRTAHARTAHPVLLPREPHRNSVDREIDVAHDRAFFDPGPSCAVRTADLVEHLLDHQFHVRSVALVTQDADVFETHQRMKDLTRLDQDEGASCFLAHTSSLKRLRPILGDPGRSSSQPKRKLVLCCSAGSQRIQSALTSRWIFHA
jgi:hypothetical protein